MRVLMIGHSKHPWDRFSALLKEHDVRILCDVRSSPRSRFSPQFNAEALRRNCAAIGIDYRHMPVLGGKSPRPLPELRDYITKLQPFEEGMCFMCSEGDYHECHRHYLLAPFFLELGVQIEQILPDSSTENDTGPTPYTLDRMRAFLPKE